MQINLHLTRGDPNFEDRIKATREGQAHWADDPIRTRRECALWGYAGEPHKRHRRKLGGAPLRDRPCVKFEELTGKRGPPVPYDARACRFFEHNPGAPPVSGKY